MARISFFARAAIPLWIAMTTGLALTAPSSAHAGATDLFDFDSASGFAPWAGVVVDGKGNLFGSTTIGGSGPCFGFSGCGTLYELSPPAQGEQQWQFTKLYDFQDGLDGQGPHAPLTLGPHGELFGYTTGGSFGTVFRLMPPAGARTTWRFDILYVFQGGDDGDLLYVEAPLVPKAGVLYGVASGGVANCGVNVGCGSVFRLERNADGQWMKRTLHAFQGGAKMAGEPNWIIAQGDPAPLVVSTSWRGGDVVVLTPAAGGDELAWSAKVVASFDGGGAGKRPSHLVNGAAGVVYGVAGSKRGAGIAFELVPPGAGADGWTRNIIARISDHRYGPDWLAAGTHGSLIGTVFGDFDFYPGSVFRLVPPAAMPTRPAGVEWTVDFLWSFRRGPDRNPENVVTGPGGNLFGVLSGGDSTNGSVYELPSK
jgi:hypothetical protein